MAEEFLGSDDDAQLRGGSAPAQNPSSINISTPGSSDSNGQKTSKVQPGSNQLGTDLRRWNPLSKLSSYTYRLTLYMLSPEALNYYANNGVLPKAGEGIYVIVAQSGGINNESEPRGLTTDPQGAPGPGKPGLDFYIDDLQFETFLLAQDRQKTATTHTSFTFKVIEPIGFTFQTKLANVCTYINNNSALINGSGSLPNLYQQHYMIGIKFYGYDVNGKILESGEVEDIGQIVSQDKFALFERLFPLSGNKVTFNVGPKSTVYSWECTLMPVQAAYGSKLGDLPNQATLEGATVGELLGDKAGKNKKSLIGWLNSIQEDRTTNKNQSNSNVYDLEWKENNWTDATKIKNSPMITNEHDNATAPMGSAQNTQQSNVAASQKAVSINTKAKTVGLPAGMSIVSAIDQVVVKSAYIVETLTKEINSRIEAVTEDNSKGVFTWYYVKPVVTIGGRDKITNDWHYTIKYYIGPYNVPYLKSQYVTARSKYYGPVKLYEYTFTGKNTEVIGFEMAYNNSFYVQRPVTTSEDGSKPKNPATTTPIVPATGVDSNSTAGTRNSGSLIAETVRANLYSVADQALVTIKIMGDPDFIMDSIGHKLESDSFSKFYGKNDSINPYSGHIFVEIVFKVAEDYKNNGLLDVDPNQTIAFYPIEQQQKIGNRGLIYRISKVTSNFTKGKFEQTLDMYMVPPTELIMPTVEEQREQGRKNLRQLENQTLENERANYVKANPRAALRQIENDYDQQAITNQQTANAGDQPTKPVTVSSDDDSNPSGYESAFITASSADSGGREQPPNNLSRLDRLRQFFGVRPGGAFSPTSSGSGRSTGGGGP